MKFSPELLGLIEAASNEGLCAAAAEETRAMRMTAFCMRLTLHYGDDIPRSLFQIPLLGEL